MGAGRPIAAWDAGGRGLGFRTAGPPKPGRRGPRLSTRVFEERRLCGIWLLAQ